MMRGIEGFFTWDDVVANCYVALKDAISSEASFLGEYFEASAGSGQSNPNIGLLWQTAEVVGRYVHEALIDYTSVDESVERVLTLISGSTLEPFGMADSNDLTLLWAVIKGIDFAYGDKKLFHSLRKRGPRNSIRSDRVGVYLVAPTSAMGVGLIESGLTHIPELTFNNQLWNISFYMKESGRRLPRIRMTVPRRVNPSNPLVSLSGVDLAHPKPLILSAPLPQAPSERSAGSSRWPINLPDVVRIGLAMFSCGRIAGPEDAAANDIGNWPITFAYSHGRDVTVSYAEDYERKYSQTVCDVLDVCGENDCDIVVFPELVMSDGLRETMQKHLASISGKSRPSLVVAGSSWLPNETGEKGNNVAFLFDGYGRDLGRYYKHSPFVVFEENGSPLMVEGLESPGKECTIVDVFGIGRVLPSICNLNSNRFIIGAKCSAAAGRARRRWRPRARALRPPS